MLESLTLRLSACKCFVNEAVPLSPITVLTGINSGGKTTVLSSLLLLKHAADAFATGVQPGWPVTVGEIRIGTWNTFLRFGSNQKCVIFFEGLEAISLGISPGVVGFTNLPPPEILRSRWRVCSTAHLPLCIEQDVANCSLDDRIYGLKHALLELLEYELRRKPESLAHSAPVRSTVENILGSVTSPIRVELSRTDFPEKLRLMYLGNSIESDSTPPEQTGAGITAALPLIIHLVTATAGEVLIIQDPESHLHPRGQSQIGREIARCASRGVQVVVETHSEHILNGIKLGLLGLERDPSQDLGCYYLDNVAGKSEITKVEIDTRGRTRRWPDGFFDQAERDLADLARGGRHGS